MTTDQPYEMLYDYYVGATKLKSKQKMPSRASPSTEINNTSVEHPAKEFDKS